MNNTTNYINHLSFEGLLYFLNRSKVPNEGYSKLLFLTISRHYTNFFEIHGIEFEFHVQPGEVRQAALLAERPWHHRLTEPRPA